MSEVRIRALVKRHGSVTAVGGIDLDVADGELVVLLGPSGCGKTTTLRCIAGLEDATEGEIHIDGQLVSSAAHSLPPEKRAIGMVFQSYALWPHMTVSENLAFGLKLRGMERGVAAAKVEAALRLVGLEALGGRNAGELSGGQQQRVALARAVVLEPRILLFDEPLSNLDAKMRERMRLEIRKLQKRLGITSIYVTHDQQEAMVIADRIVLMQAGRIEQIARPRDLYERPATRFAAEFIGLTNVLAGTVRAIADGVAEVEAGGLVLRTTQAAGRAAGDKVDVLIRPEHFRLFDNPVSGPNATEGRVVEALFLGNTGELAVQAGDSLLRLQLSPPGRQVEEQRVWLDVDPAMVALLDRSDATTAH